jgi:ligand-binding sensor domain-containing protein/anti-sigma regulatory factor (Ser/Thr protein kinase)
VANRWIFYAATGIPAIFEVPAPNMLRSNILYIIFLTVCCFTGSGYAQSPASQPFKTITVADGIPQSFISGLVQDQQGFIWIGTRDGLARFDGLQYKLFNHVPGDTGSLASNVITNLQLDRQNRLWILYETGDIDVLNTVTEFLFHFSRHAVFKETKRKVKGGYSIAQFLGEDDQGNTWLLGGKGGVFICQLEQRRLQYFSDTALGLGNNKITSITTTGNNLLLVTDTALVTMNAGRQVTAIIPYTFERPHLFNAERPWKDTRVNKRKNGDLVIMDENRLLVYQAAKGSFLTYALPDQALYSGPCVTMDDKDNVYFDLSGTIYRLSTDNRLLVWRPRKNGLYPNAISMLSDRSGVLWVGGNGSGIDLYDMRLPHITGAYYVSSFFKDVLQLSENVPSRDIDSTFIDKTNPYQVKRTIGADFVGKAGPFQIRHTTGKDGTMWFALSGRGGKSISQLCYVKDGRMHTVSFRYEANNMKHEGINALAFNDKGILWGIDFNFRLVRFNIAAQTVAVYPSLFLTSGFNDLLIDGEQTFWITSMSQGLFRYDLSTGRLTQFEQKDEPGQLPTGQLLDMQNDPGDSTVMWIASMGGGLIRFDKKTGQCKSFTTKDGLPNNTVYAIIPDAKGVLWCSSNKGIFTFDPRSKAIRSFTTKDGLLNDEFNRFHFLRLADGRMAFGGVNSYTIFDPLAITEDDFQPRVVLTGLSINNEPADYGNQGSPFTQSLNSLQQITLPYYRNFLSFHFAALEYNIPDKLQYRYQLVGVDDKWVYLKTGNTATYTNIPSGSYELLVNATNTSGKWSPYIKKIFVVITPPFWKTWWFISFCVIVVAAVVCSFFYVKIQSVRAKEKQQLKFDREVMELEAQALRAQMNPHFIFNCLNSIKLLINEDKKRQAVIYLTTFSKLIRSQLSNTQKEISLAEEIKTCRLYVQMESLRFGNKVSCEFMIPENTDLYSLMVPPLIIQPFIENAIWHGILPKEEGGAVVLKIEETADAIQCIIDDDGIGRTQSQQHQSATATTHQSKGMQLTQSRMHLYNLAHHHDSTITVTDKKDEEGKVCGTTVTINFKKEI